MSEGLNMIHDTLDFFSGKKQFVGKKKMEIVRTEGEIERLEAWAVEGQSNGTHYKGMTYEDGIMETLYWIFGRRDSSPAGDGD
jgi:hypothetical protein